MGRCDRTTTKTRGLNRQRGKGAVQGDQDVLNVDVVVLECPGLSDD
jgi:hypothetical protein